VVVPGSLSRRSCCPSPDTLDLRTTNECTVISTSFSSVQTPEWRLSPSLIAYDIFLLAVFISRRLPLAAQ
jgi:hypothetical protein